MTGEASQRLVGLLREARSSDSSSPSELIELFHGELRRIAGGMMRNRAPGDTLQATALVNEMFLQLVGSKELAPESRAHFLAIAARAMRQVLGRHAADRRSLKRGGAFARVSFVEGCALDQTDSSSVALDAALEKLASLDPRQARVIEMRFFADMTMEEIAEALEVSNATVERDWRMARAWMRAELARETAE